MEYRHGPISVSGDDTVVWVFGDAPAGLARDVAGTGATFVDDDLDPLVDLIRAQRVAVELAHKNGRDPDHPLVLVVQRHPHRFPTQAVVTRALGDDPAVVADRRRRHDDEGRDPRTGRRARPAPGADRPRTRTRRGARHDCATSPRRCSTTARPRGSNPWRSGSPFQESWTTTGVGRYSVTFGWRDLPVRARLEESLSRPVLVEHDVRAGAAAEVAFGAAVGERTAVFLPVGTGISAAIVRDGMVAPGETFQAGELGQVLVPAPRIGAASRDDVFVTLEATSSARAIAERYARALGPAARRLDHRRHRRPRRGRRGRLCDRSLGRGGRSARFGARRHDRHARPGSDRPRRWPQPRRRDARRPARRSARSPPAVADRAAARHGTIRRRRRVHRLRDPCLARPRRSRRGRPRRARSATTGGAR